MKTPSRLRLAARMVPLATLALAGCASMSADECRMADWHTVGYEDGVSGYAGDRIGEHRRSCAKHGVAPDFVAYQAGRTRGLREFCRPEVAYRIGSGGGDYPGVCAADAAPGFDEAYGEGREYYLRASRVSELESRLAHKRHRIADLERSIAEDVALVADRDATPEQRAEALLDTKSASEQIGRLRAELPELEHELAVARDHLDDYRELQVQRLR